jgi:hypothetical protein
MFPNYLPEILILLLRKWNYEPKHPFALYSKFHKECNNDAMRWTDWTAERPTFLAMTAIW